VGHAVDARRQHPAGEEGLGQVLKGVAPLHLVGTHRPGQHDGNRGFGDAPQLLARQLQGVRAVEDDDAARRRRTRRRELHGGGDDAGRRSSPVMWRLSLLIS
jgi:hypothetical protein